MKVDLIKFDCFKYTSFDNKDVLVLVLKKKYQRFVNCPIYMKLKTKVEIVLTF